MRSSQVCGSAAQLVNFDNESSELSLFRNFFPCSVYHLGEVNSQSRCNSQNSFQSWIALAGFNVGNHLRREAGFLRDKIFGQFATHQRKTYFYSSHKAGVSPFGPTAVTGRAWKISECLIKSGCIRAGAKNSSMINDCGVRGQLSGIRSERRRLRSSVGKSAMKALLDAVPNWLCSRQCEVRSKKSRLAALLDFFSFGDQL